MRIGLLIVAAGVVFNIHDADELIAFYDNGHGPLSQLPLWVQGILFLVLADFMLYWLHRLFHGCRTNDLSNDPNVIQVYGNRERRSSVASRRVKRHR